MVFNHGPKCCADSVSSCRRVCLLQRQPSDQHPFVSALQSEGVRGNKARASGSGNCLLTLASSNSYCWCSPLWQLCSVSTSVNVNHLTESRAHETTACSWANTMDPSLGNTAEH
jgi:hypothetical protein